MMKRFDQILRLWDFREKFNFTVMLQYGRKLLIWEQVAKTKEICKICNALQYNTLQILFNYSQTRYNRHNGGYPNVHSNHKKNEPLLQR